MENSCLDLIPQSAETIIRDSRMRKQIIRMLIFSIVQLIESLSQFYITKQYSAFDPHVGDTLCQIRAYNLMMVSCQRDQRRSNILQRLNELAKIHQKLKDISVNIEPDFLNNHWTISEYIKHHSCHYSLSSTERFLFEARFLTRFKLSSFNNETFVDYNKICKILGVARKSAKKLTRYYQLSLAEFSCQSVINWAKEINFPVSQLQALKQLKRFDDDNRVVLPCYFATKILLKHHRKFALPLLLLAERKAKSGLLHHTAIYWPKLSCIHPMLITDFKMKVLDTPCFIISGETVYNHDTFETDQLFADRIIALGLEKILLANMAIHPQYSGNRSAMFSENPFVSYSLPNKTANEMEAEFLQMRQSALDTGCSKCNPSLFSVKHIYYDSLKNQHDQLMFNPQLHFSVLNSKQTIAQTDFVDA